MKTCERCGKSWPDIYKICTDCGVSLPDKGAESMNSYDKMCDEQLLEIVNNPDDFDAAAVKKAKSILDGRKYIAQRTGGSENSQITEYLSMLLESQNIHTSILHKIEKYCLFFVIVTCVSLFIAFILAIWAASLAGSF